MSDGPAEASGQPTPQSNDWQIARISEPESWLPVPRGLDEEQIGEWGSQVIAQLEADWATDWDKDFSYLLALTLAGVARTRELGDAPMYLCWPLPLPLCMSIEVNVADSSDLPDWDALGYDMRYYETEGLGPGLHGVRTQNAAIGEPPDDLVSAAFVFDDGVSSVVIATDAVPSRVAALVSVDLHHLVHSLVVGRPDGPPFRGEPSRSLLTGVEDVWEFADGR